MNRIDSDYPNGPSGLIEKLSLNIKRLDKKKEHTGKKIEFVSAYVAEWLNVVSNWREATHITFIDCMSNAGIYQDDELGTAPIVLRIMKEHAQKHPEKNYTFVINDKDKARVAICKRVCEEVIGGQRTRNLALCAYEKDVNDFLCEMNEGAKKPLDSYGAITFLFADPYNARTIDFRILREFLEKHYSELLFNWFISDHVRNAGDKAIEKCFESMGLPKGAEASSWIPKQLKNGRIRVSFSFAFRTRTNCELYQLIFASPHERGLSRFKDVIWDVFDGEEYFRNSHGSDDQLTLFSHEDSRLMNLTAYAPKAQEKCVEVLAGKCVPFYIIERIVLEQTMLKSSHVISHVLKPLIKAGLVVKKNIKGKRNYKDDEYVFAPKG